jgi:UDP-glucose 4-epimerase
MPTKRRFADAARHPYNRRMPATLVTGGAGYIGSHVAVALAATGRDIVCLDNYVNSSPAAVERLRRLVPSLIAYECDIREGSRVAEIARRHGCDSVIHMAGLKAVGESVEQPLRYYDNNITGTLEMLKGLQATPVRQFVFSSSATVYGLAETMPIDEAAPTSPQSPYGHTKLMIEQVLGDLAAADRSWRVVNLRYFNPVGAHESGLIGELPAGVPNNLMPYVCQTAAGVRDALSIFGNDYPTRDGTGVRDFIHVMDLAEGHVAALRWLADSLPGPPLTVNLGTGRGYSVLELVDAFERVNGVKVARRFAPRRPGDVVTCYADASLAERVLGWKATRGIEEMCRDAWRWERVGMDPASRAAKSGAS